jgi:hypothetical protein
MPIAYAGRAADHPANALHARRGGETMQVKPLQSTGSTLEINEQGREYMTGNKERWEKQATDEKAERERQQALAAEHRKARAAEEQAAAQRDTARAIWATGRRW